jgi:hypothetical protein
MSAIKPASPAAAARVESVKTSPIGNKVGDKLVDFDDYNVGKAERDAAVAVLNTIHEPLSVEDMITLRNSEAISKVFQDSHDGNPNTQVGSDLVRGKLGFKVKDDAKLLGRIISNEWGDGDPWIPEQGKKLDREEFKQLVGATPVLVEDYADEVAELPQRYEYFSSEDLKQDFLKWVASVQLAANPGGGVPGPDGFAE